VISTDGEGGHGGVDSAGDDDSDRYLSYVGAVGRVGATRTRVEADLAVDVGTEVFF
jgi:hypothetical protein